MVVVDQNAAMIAAVRSVFPNSFIVLDDWHLNKNQLRNTAVWCAKISRQSWAADMSRDLHMMRKLGTLEQLHSKREAFEEKYFTSIGMDPPKWYKFLYHSNPSMVVEYYKKVYMPFRFLFQGTGYSEASNSMFAHHIVRRRIPIHEVPQAMIELTERRIANRNAALENKKGVFNRLSSSPLSVPRAELMNLCQFYSCFCLKKFLRCSVQEQVHYKVIISYFTFLVHYSAECTKTMGIRENENIAIAVFIVGRARMNEVGEEERFEVFCCTSQQTGDPTGSFKAGCTCWKPIINGFPCPHIVRVATVFPEELNRSPELQDALGARFQLEQLFHDYWRDNDRTWSLQRIASLRKVVGWPGENLKTTCSVSEDGTSNVNDAIHKAVVSTTSKNNKPSGARAVSIIGRL